MYSTRAICVHNAPVVSLRQQLYFGRRLGTKTCTALQRHGARCPRRALRVCATTELQRSDIGSKLPLQGSSTQAGAAVEVSHVSMAFGDRQVQSKQECFSQDCPCTLAHSSCALVSTLSLRVRELHVYEEYLSTTCEAQSATCRCSLTYAWRSLGARSTC